MAAFSALAHTHSHDIDAIPEALGRALQGMDWQASDYFHEFLDVNLGNTPMRQ